MTEKDLDIAIEKCEQIMEFDTRTLNNPESEDGWIFDKVYDLLQFLRQFQFVEQMPSAQPSVSKTEIIGDTISRQAAITEFSRCELTPDGGIDVNYAIDFLEQMPPVDAVPVVRCKDCKHYQFADNRAFGFPVKRCEWTGFEDVDDDDFCSRAERRTDD